MLMQAIRAFQQKCRTDGLESAPTPSIRFLICTSSSVISMFHAFKAASALPMIAGTSSLDIASEFA